ncbi:tripartite motif-containing protein 59-like [Ambystoma mexicanum]|uniref:tripartite motif-containing protein 59-like n=1 Tax=Ambystoma mexicanum TaxID=8296 RepID=UPI0037E94196
MTMRCHLLLCQVSASCGTGLVARRPEHTNTKQEQLLLPCPEPRDDRNCRQAKEINNLEEELTCCICSSIYEDPRVLPCSHTFCRNCLENVVQASSNYSIWRLIRLQLKCPICRSIAKLPSGGIGTLPTNFVLRAIIEKYSKEDHQRILRCPEHSRQPLNVYCLLDRKLVCVHCLTIGQHQGHPIDDLQSAYVKEKSTPCKLMELLSDKQWTRICELIDHLEVQKSESVTMVQEQKKEALQYFKKINDTVENKKQDLLATLNDANSKIVAEYDSQIEKMKEIQEEQMELLSLCSSIQEEESPLIFLEKVDDIRQRVKSLRKQKILPVNHTELYPPIEQVLKQQWSKTEIEEIDKFIVPKIELFSKEQLESKSDTHEKRFISHVLNLESKSNTKEKRLISHALNLPVTAVFLCMLVALIVILCKTMSTFPILNETSLIYITDLMQTIADALNAKLQAVRSAFENDSNVLFDFMHGMISYIYVGI